jgi:hypothetical protein
MAIITDFRIEGLKEIEARLTELDALAGKRLLTRATRRSLIKLERQATSNAESFARSGALAESVRIVTVKPRGTNVVEVQVGPKKSDKKAKALHNVYYDRKRKGIFYGHLIEFGHRVGTRSTGWLRKGNKTKGKGGSSSGQVPARPWFTPAWNATRTDIIPEFQRILAQGLSRLERRMQKKAADAEGLVDS